MCKKISLFLVIFFSLFVVQTFANEVHQYKWTFIVYMAADNNLEAAAIDDFLEMASIGSTSDVAIVVQLDRIGGTETDTRFGDWTGCARFKISQSDIPMLEDAVQDLGEVDMGDSQILVDFVNWTKTNYSASHYALILWNHGDGWREIERLRKELRTRGATLSPEEQGKILNEISRLEQRLQEQKPWKAVCIDDTSAGDALTMKELSGALGTIGTNIDLIGFDACLMGMLEVAYEIKDYGTVMVASEDLVPWYGWPYTTILQDLTGTPTMTPEALGSAIVNRYGEYYYSAYDGDYRDSTTLSAVRLGYSMCDLQGTWNMNFFRCGGEGECEVSFGRMSVDDRGNMTWLEGEPDDNPNKVYITPAGIVFVENEEGPLPFHGTMSQDKSTIVANFDDEYDGESYQLIVLQKSSNDFTTNDIQGTWNMHSFRCDGDGHCGWSRGIANIESGSMSWVENSFENSGDESDDESDAVYTVSVDGNGIISIQEDGEDLLFHGTMSQDKNVVVATMTSTGYDEYENEYTDSELIILQKSSDDFTTSDLQGTWSIHSLGCNYYEGDGGWWEYSGLYGMLGIDSDGNMFDMEEGEFAGARAIITDTGIVSIEFDGEPLPFHGTMSRDKNMIVMNGGEIGETDTDYQFIILQKSGGPIETLSQAVSNFAQAVRNEDADWDVISNARQQAGYYNAPYNDYRDLRGFMEKVSENAENDTIVLAAQNVITAFDQCIIANNHSSTVFSREITGGTTASAYVMISSPVLPINPDPEANLQDDLGSYDNTQWRLFRWNPTPSAYEEYPFSGEFGDVVPGKGYWLISRDSATIDITGKLVNNNNGLSIYFPDCGSSVDPNYYNSDNILFAETQWDEFLLLYVDREEGPIGTDYSILLYPGWNQIGNPFNFVVDWDTSVQVTDGEITYPVVYTENTLTSQILWKYEGGDYIVPGTMEPGEGYWVKNITEPPRNVFLIVNPVRSTLPKEYIDSLERTLTAFGRATEESPPPPPGGIDSEPDKENGSGSGKSGCFIATACFGSPMAGEVEVLRNFRDKYLVSNTIGQVFVSLYYRCSPPIAEFIGNHKFLKVMIRSSLYPVVKGCELIVKD